MFFCTIDLAYLHTFLSMKTAPQYTCEWFLMSETDAGKWDAVFENRSSYTKAVHNEVKVWVGANIVRWQSEKPDWFDIGMIADDLLPEGVLQAASGAARITRKNTTLALVMCRDRSNERSHRRSQAQPQSGRSRDRVRIIPIGSVPIDRP